MKLNRAMLWATATVATAAVMGVGWISVVGIDRTSESPVSVGEQADQAEAVDSDAPGTAENSNGVEEYARGGGAVRGGGARGGAVHAVARGGGFDRGGGWGRGHEGGWGRGHEGGWGRGGSSRWGRWGGGRYVGGRWVGGPYYGWCDDRYYACNRAWW